MQTFALPLGYGTVCGAVDEIRTRDIHLGKVALYQLSYYRIPKNVHIIAYLKIFVKHFF